MGPEPWLRGPLADVSPLLTPTLHAYQQAREDLARWTSTLTVEQLWRTVGDIPSVGFQLRHIAGSVDRLTTYLKGENLSEAQLTTLRQEAHTRADHSELLNEVEAALASSEVVIRTLPLESLSDIRAVGRQALPTTVMGLVVHLAEHTQRHVGQAITTAKLVRQS